MLSIHPVFSEAKAPGDRVSVDVRSFDNPVDFGKTNSALQNDFVRKPSSVQGVPQRYTIRETDGGQRTLTCIEAPNISVRVEAGLTFSSSAAHKSAPGTIFLDGVAQSAPFLDLEKQIYNFDHHEGCVRQFTLSTCEQVLVMILKGIDLRGRDWKIYANEPDLDTVLSIWLLLNHVRIQQRDSVGMRFLSALVRLEGIIDAHGLEMTDLSGFPANLLDKAKKAIDYLRAEEIDLKKHAIWEESDYLEHTALILHKIDRLVYKSDDFADFKDLNELGRVRISNSRIAVAVEAELGIYELEPYLNRLYGENLGIAILKKEANTYTLRRMDPFMPGDLNEVYQRLNDIDPAVRCRTGGNRWGGSNDIGGSPRGAGTRLTPEEIVQACRDAFRKPDFASKVKLIFRTFFTVVGLVAASALSQSYLKSQTWFTESPVAGFFLSADFLFFITLLLLSSVCILFFSRRKIWLFGIITPSGKDWWFLLPVVILASAAGGIYFPETIHSRLAIHQRIVYLFIIIPLSVEVLFRGLIHGTLALGFPVQNCQSRWFFSYPSLFSAFLYGVFITCLVLFPDIRENVFQTGLAAKSLFAASTFGLANGFVRERSQSILPPILFHSAAMAVFIF